MTIIVADTTCELPCEVLNQRNIHVVPQIITFGIPSYQLPPAIVVHAGPKAMGVGFFYQIVGMV